MKNIQLPRFLKYVGVGKFKAIRSPPPSWQRGKPSRDPRRMQTYGSPPAPARARPSGKKGLSAAKKDGVVPVGAALMPRGRPEEADRGAPEGEDVQVQAARSPSQKGGQGHPGDIADAWRGLPYRPGLAGPHARGQPEHEVRAQAQGQGGTTEKGTPSKRRGIQTGLRGPPASPPLPSSRRTSPSGAPDAATPRWRSRTSRSAT